MHVLNSFKQERDEANRAFLTPAFQNLQGHVASCGQVILSGPGVHLTHQSYGCLVSEQLRQKRMQSSDSRVSS